MPAITTTSARRATPLRRAAALLSAALGVVAVTLAAGPAQAAVPAAPQQIIVTQGGGAVAVTFLDPGTTTPASTGYEISLDGGATWRGLTTTASTRTVGARQRVLSGSTPATDGWVYRVSVRAVTATGRGEATPVWSTAPSWGSTKRLRGPDRTATAITVSQDVFPEVAAAPAAVLTTSATYADALAGGALAAQVHGPLLLTPPGHLDGAVAAEVRRAVEPGGVVYVLGDTGAVSKDVEQQLRPGFTVTRLAGEDRYATALAVADRMRASGAKGPAYLVTGTDFPDGLAVAALAARTGGVVVLSRGFLMDADTQEWLAEDDATGGRTVPVGGPARTAASVLGAAVLGNAIDGVDRYDTARRVAAAFGKPYRGLTTGHVGLVTGGNWPDALVAGAAMGHLDGPLLLTDGGAPSLTPATALALSDLTADGRPSSGLVFGGADVLSDGAAQGLSLSLPAPGA